MCIRAPRSTIVGAALFFALAVFSFGTPASAYPDVQITNTTKFVAHVKIAYHSCRGDRLTVKPGASARPQTRRGGCLILSITATLTGGPTVRAFTSSGTGLSKFALVTTGGQVAVERR